MAKIKVAIVGATGYVGAELFWLLTNHDDVEIVAATSVSYLNKPFNTIYSNFKKITEITCGDGSDLESLSKNADVVFLSLPHGLASKSVNESVLSKAKIIDMGADFRLREKEIYEEWYKTEHGSPHLLPSAIYGLCEIYRNKIKDARLVANPGCYTTCSILSLLPLVKSGFIDNKSIIIDAKSGVSGAGRSATTDSLYCECNESIKPYKVGSHRHTPEIEQELSLVAGQNIAVSFTPHLVPMNRGILATIYARLTKSVSYEDIRAIYENAYKNEYFVRLLSDGVFPETRWVRGSNFLDIGFKIDERTGNIVVMGAIDNLMKGAAGQAVQNLNIMFGLDEQKVVGRGGRFPI